MFRNYIKLDKILCKKTQTTYDTSMTNFPCGRVSIQHSGDGVEVMTVLSSVKAGNSLEKSLVKSVDENSGKNEVDVSGENENSFLTVVLTVLSLVNDGRPLEKSCVISVD